MKKRLLLLATTLVFATATFFFWLSNQNSVNQQLDALDKDLMEIKKNL